MEFKNEKVRRQDRLLSEERARQLLREGEFGVLSMVAPEGEAYGIPINFVWDGEGSIYLHCAPEGRKLCCIDHCADVSFCVVGQTHVVSDKFTTGYESIVLKCRAFHRLPAEERMHALELFIAKYSPDDQVLGRKYAEKSFFRTEIIRLDISEFSGKAKVVR